LSGGVQLPASCLGAAYLSSCCKAQHLCLLVPYKLEYAYSPV
jgi:hypothetical protein